MKVKKEPRNIRLVFFLLSILEIQSYLAEDSSLELEFMTSLESPNMDTSGDESAPPTDLPTTPSTTLAPLPPSITSTLPQTVYLLSGSSLNLSCEAFSESPPSYIWYLSTDDSDEVIKEKSDDGALMLNDVTHKLSGQLNCKASNPYGEDIKSTQLVVVDPIEIINDDHDATIVKHAGESLTLNCDVKVDPLIVETVSRKWMKDGVEVGDDLTTGNEDDNVHISYLVSENSGEYTCHVSTVVDNVEITRHMTVVTEPPSVTDLPARVGGMEGDTVEIACAARGIPFPEISFKLDHNVDLLPSSSDVNGNLTVSSVHVSEPGNYTCLAVNVYGNDRKHVTVDIFTRTQITRGIGSETVNSGDDVTITCQATVDPRLSMSMRKVWMKDEAPLDTSDARVTINEDGDVTISDTETTDEGQYECQVFTEYDMTSSTGRLTVLNESPSINSIPNNIRVLEGRDKSLLCQASGIPTPVITWSFSDRVLDSEDGLLDLVDVGRNQEGRYVCLAKNRYGVTEREVQLQVIRGLRKENENLVPDIVKNIKDTISLPCDFKVDKRVENETKFIWLKNSEELTIDDSRYSLLPNKSLLLQNISLKDNGYYTCNVVTPLQSVNSTIQLIVSGEAPEILNNFDKITIHEGETLELDCRARGSPRPSLEWLVRDRPVLSSYLVDVTMADSEFIEKRVRIRGAGKEHEGVYQCVAANNVGSLTRISHVAVIKRTKVKIVGDDGPQEMAIQAGQPAKLPCRVENDERNRITNIAWTKDDMSLQVGVEDRIDFGYDGSMTIFNVQKRHEGRYKCKVKTLRDEASAEVPLRVIVNAPVITKFSEHQKVFSGTSLELECQATGIPSPETSWTFNKTSTSITGENYHIKSAMMTDSGFYTCTSKNSIGETKQTIQVSVVTLPRLDDEYKIKKYSELLLPCVRSNGDVRSEWKRDDVLIQDDADVNIDKDGNLILLSMSEKLEGDYSCHVTITGTGEERVLQTYVLIMPDIVLTKSKKLVINEGGNFTLKCDALPGVNAKKIWKKNGDLVLPSLEAGVDIIDYSSTLVVYSAKVSETGTWTCVVTTPWGGRDTIEYDVKVKQARVSCSEPSAPIIQSITGVSNTSVRLEWEVQHFNQTCYEEFKIFYWSNQTNQSFLELPVALNHKSVTIGSLKPLTAYYFQVNLVRDSRNKIYQYGHTKSHLMNYLLPQDLMSSSNPKAVIIIVLIIIVFLFAILVLLYYKRRELTDYILERKKAKASATPFAEYPTKLTANPDFMASLAPQWPEPEPDPTEDQAFLQQQRQLSKRRGSKTSITSSWSSLFNVVSTEDITSEQQFRDSMYKGRSRKE